MHEWIDAGAEIARRIERVFLSIATQVYGLKQGQVITFCIGRLHVRDSIDQTDPDKSKELNKGNMMLLQHCNICHKYASRHSLVVRLLTAVQELQRSVSTMVICIAYSLDTLTAVPRSIRPATCWCRVK